MLKIPPKNKDLRRYVLFKDLRKLMLYALWLAIWYFGAYAYNQNHQSYPPERRMMGWKLLLWMLAAALLGFVLFRIWTIFTDRSYRAVITRSGLSQSYEASRDPGLHNATDYDFRLNTALQIQKLGKSKKSRIHFEQKLGFYFYYYEGTEIVKLHGLPYPIAVGSEHPDAKKRICAACGQIATGEETRCQICAHTLIDPQDLHVQ